MSVISSTVVSYKENTGPQFQELDEVLRNAQLRRTAELGGWLRQYFENRRQVRLQKPASLPTTTTTQTVTV
jgi:hypothetical protein